MPHLLRKIIWIIQITKQKKKENDASLDEPFSKNSKFKLHSFANMQN